MKKILFIIIVLFFLVLPTKFILAQVVTSGASEMGLTITPANPGPNSTTTIKVSSFAFNPNASTFTWTLNGKKALSGLNQSSFSFKTGNLGSQSVVSIAALDDGRLFEKTITFYQNDADLLWEVVNGYAPGFYEGKIFPAAGDTVQISATPSIFDNGKLVAATKLNYTWSENFKSLPEQSGVGKRSLTFTADRSTNSFIVDVTITNPAKPSVSLRRSVVIPSPNLQAILYPTIPLVGALYGQALTGKITPSGNNLSLKAEVFNISPNDLPSLNFSWSLNGKPIAVDPTNPGTITVNNPLASTSQSLLSLKVASLDNIFETAQNFLTIIWGNSVQF